jgi:hypothetical protein
MSLLMELEIVIAATSYKHLAPHGAKELKRHSLPDPACLSRMDVMLREDYRFYPFKLLKATPSFGPSFG